jgi:lysophospholipase L1-like esterase
VLTASELPNSDKVRVQDFESMLPCLNGSDVLDLRSELREKTELFLPDDTHLNAEGTARVADLVSLSAPLQKLKKK